MRERERTSNGREGDRLARGRGTVTRRRRRQRQCVYTRANCSSCTGTVFTFSVISAATQIGSLGESSPPHTAHFPFIVPKHNRTAIRVGRFSSVCRASRRPNPRCAHVRTRVRAGLPTKLTPPYVSSSLHRDNGRRLTYCNDYTLLLYYIRVFENHYDRY